MMERSVLSCLMKSADLLEEVPLEPEIFHLPAHREIYRVLRETRDGDLVRIVSKLQERGLLENIGGPSAVTEVYTYAPGERYFARHLEILRDRHARRRAVAACQAAIEKAQDCSGEEGDADFLDALAGPISAVFDTMTAAEAPADTKALAREFLDAYERRVAGVEEPGGLPTGIAEVDRHLHGLQPRQMGIISARSGGGKSTLIALLQRFYEVGDGRITVDGQDVSRVTQHSLRKVNAVGPQAPGRPRRSRPPAWRHSGRAINGARRVPWR